MNGHYSFTTGAWDPFQLCGEYNTHLYWLLDVQAYGSVSSQGLALVHIHPGHQMVPGHEV